MQKNTILRPYEAVVLMHPDSSVEEQKNLFRKNKEIIESFKGRMNHLDTWGKRNVANAVAGKINKAFYFHATFESAPAAISELERTMKINDKVLRFMHTRLDERTNLTKHVENFKQSLVDALGREKERQEKNQKRQRERR